MSKKEKMSKRENMFREEARVFLDKLYEATFETSHDSIESLQESIKVEVDTFFTKVEQIDEEIYDDIKFHN